MSSLPPIPSEIGLFPRFIAQQPITLDLKEHFFGTSSFDVTHQGTTIIAYKI